MYSGGGRGASFDDFAGLTTSTSAKLFPSLKFSKGKITKSEPQHGQTNGSDVTVSSLPENAPYARMRRFPERTLCKMGTNVGESSVSFVAYFVTSDTPSSMPRTFLTLVILQMPLVASSQHSERRSASIQGHNTSK